MIAHEPLLVVHGLPQWDQLLLKFYLDSLHSNVFFFPKNMEQFENILRNN